MRRKTFRYFVENQYICIEKCDLIVERNTWTYVIWITLILIPTTGIGSSDIPLQTCNMDAFEDTQTGHMVGEEFFCAFVERYLAVICHRYRTQSLWLKLGVQHEGKSTKAVQVIATDTAFCVSTKFFPLRWEVHLGTAREIKNLCLCFVHRRLHVAYHSWWDGIVRYSQLGCPWAIALQVWL